MGFQRNGRRIRELGPIGPNLLKILLVRHEKSGSEKGQGHARRGAKKRKKDTRNINWRTSPARWLTKYAGQALTLRIDGGMFNVPQGRKRKERGPRA